jgi:hypothetical protein
VIAVLSAHVVAASADDPPPPSADGAPPPAGPSRPISESADRLVRKLDEDRKAPCGKASEGVPCFPISIEENRPDLIFSVRDSLGDLGPLGKQSPSRPPTLNEMKPFRPGPIGPVAPMFGFDPGCVGKSALKRLKGRNDTYYLYRVRDVRGERVALYDHRLEAATFQGALEFLGRFEGECNALSAYRHEGQKAGTTATSSPPPPE